MKKIIFALALLVSFQIAYAQQAKDAEAAAKKVELAKAASLNEKKAANMATWIKLGQTYLDAYNAAFNASASNWTEANNAMQVIDAAWEEIAINAELWAEYKQVGAEAEALLNSNLYSEDAKAFLRAYYVQVYQKRLSDLELSNEQLPDAIQELRDYMAPKPLHDGSETF